MWGKRGPAAQPDLSAPHGLGNCSASVRAFANQPAFRSARVAYPPDNPSHPLAVLIDADNARPETLDGLLAAVASLGRASVRRIYGDWTTPNLVSWKAPLLEHSFQPIQQFRYTTGKNATDSAMIIDAMDLLHAGHLAGFCIVSSDSDFTRLAMRIRETERRVYGFGERITPKPFVAACDQFFFVDAYRRPTVAAPVAGGLASAADGAASTVKAATAAPTAESTPPSRASQAALRGDTRLMNALREAVRAQGDPSGWALLGAVGSRMKTLITDFNASNYGFAKLSDLIAEIDLFEMERRNTHFFVRDMRRSLGNTVIAGQRQSSEAI